MTQIGGDGLELTGLQLGKRTATVRAVKEKIAAQCAQSQENQDRILPEEQQLLVEGSEWILGDNDRLGDMIVPQTLDVRLTILGT